MKPPVVKRSRRPMHKHSRRGELRAAERELKQIFKGLREPKGGWGR